VLVVSLGLWPQPAWAVVTQFDRPALTAELLQQRLRSPLQSDGMAVLDLSRVTIDLRPENAAFREQFYSLVQAQLQRPGKPVGLDLSYSQIQGDFQFSKLGLRAPLFGESLSKLFSEAEQAQLQRDRRRLSRLSTLSRTLLATPTADEPVPSQLTVFRGVLMLTQTRFSNSADFSNTFFLNRIEAIATQFIQDVQWAQARFSQVTDFTSTTFRGVANFRSTIFFAKADFDQTLFQSEANFQSAEFQAAAGFNRVTFQKTANLTRVQWQGAADFAQTHWLDQALFTRSSFAQGLFLTDAVFDKAALFREVRFSQPVNLRGAGILERADFGYANFAPGAYLNVAGLRFDSDRAKIVGDRGKIGHYISVPTLQGNENLLRELIRNFRKLEQIPDANQIDYTRQRLREKELRQQIFGVNLNAASPTKLRQVGFSDAQVAAIVQHRNETSFRSPAELLSVGAVDLATYIRLRDRLVATSPLPPATDALRRITIAAYSLWIGLLLLLSRYGTDFWLIFGVGLVGVAYFGVVFWFIDRWRRVVPTTVLPTVSETLRVGLTALLLATFGLVQIFRTADYPWITLVSIAAIATPVPTALLVRLYQQGRYHPMMDTSYFTEEGTLRQLRILIGRLPIIPRESTFRDRYLPILWDRRWSWLNYFDFSLNNLLRFGFNDIRLRDQHVPGLITTLVWYQWGLGLLHIALLLWTLSRTIPGLNLLIYFK